ncbi:MAG: type II toxin-antitoxin system VapC family toxin [Bacteroidota bacterium]
MNGDNYLLDTNIVLYISNGNEDLISFLNHQRITISVITEIELLSFPAITKREITALSHFIDEMEVIPVADKIKQTAISVRRKYKLKLPDGIIAATAIVYDLPLITADKQFKIVNELQLLLYDNAK